MKAVLKATSAAKTLAIDTSFRARSPRAILVAALYMSSRAASTAISSSAMRWRSTWNFEIGLPNWRRSRV